MATTQNYLRTARKAFKAVIETTPGTFQAPGATDFIPIENFDEKLNPKTTESTEVRGTLAAGETAIGGFQPDITGSAFLRGGGGVAVEPPLGPVIEVCGLKKATGIVIPATGTSTATAGTTTSFTIDTSVDTDWSAVDGAYVGRPVELSVNPVVAEIAIITKYDVTGVNAVVTVDKTFPVALSATTEAKVFPGMIYKIDSVVPPSLSVECYVDGKLRQYSGVRGNLKITLPGGEAGKFNLDLFGTFEGETDVTTPIGDFSALGPQATWRDGIARLDGLEIAATSLDIDTGNTKTRHPNPNVEPGFDIAFITKRNARGTLQTNAVLVATHDRITKLATNVKMPFAAVLNRNGTPGTRWALTMPAFKALDISLADKEGIVDDSISYQAVELLGDDELVLAIF
jgi:hypothetical protein